MKNKVILLAIIMLIVAVAVINAEIIYKTYIHWFHKSTAIEPRDSRGAYDGEVIGYLNGKTSFTADFKNGSREGWVRHFFKSGRLENEKFYRNNKANGVEREYYDGGGLNYTSLWKNNLIVGSEFHYFPTGKLMNYDAFDVNNQEIVFYIEYNSSGKVKSKIGDVFSDSIYTKINKIDTALILKNNKTYHQIKDLYITVATPPTFTSQIEININNRKYYNLNVNANTLVTRNAFPGPGVFNITILGKLLLPNKKVLKSDTLKIAIKVE